MKPNKDSENKIIKAIKRNLDLIQVVIVSSIGSIMVVLFIYDVYDFYKNPPERKKNVPHVRIDYINPDGTIRYSRYSNDVNYGRGSVYYVDFETGAIVNTTETVNVVRIN